MLNINAFEVLFTLKIDLSAEQGGACLQAQHLGSRGRNSRLFPLWSLRSAWAI